MDYRNLNDNELVFLAQEKNEQANTILHEKYKPLITKKSTRIYRFVKGKGIEYSDIFQECVIGFEEAIISFNSDDDVTFYTFCNLCMDRQLNTLIRKLNRDKYKILNEAVPIESINDFGEEISLADIFGSEEQNPERGIIANENIKELIKKIEHELTPLEECVYNLKIQGFNYKEIADILDRPAKTIDNAFQRIRIKAEKILPQGF